MGLTLISLITVSTVKETRGNDLHVAEADASLLEAPAGAAVR
jgi:hypothetical protein